MSAAIPNAFDAKREAKAIRDGNFECRGSRVDRRVTIGDRKLEMVVRLEGVTNEPRFPRGSDRRVLAFTVVAVLRFVRQASSFLGFVVAYCARASESSLTRIRVTLPRTWLPNGRPSAAVYT